MSRKNKQHHIAKRHHISVEEWLMFERFRECLPELEDAITDLDNNWQNHVTYLGEELHCWDNDFEEVSDSMKKVTDLLLHCTNRHLYYGGSSDVGRYPEELPRQGRMMVEIIVEDVSEPGNKL